MKGERDEKCVFILLMGIPGLKRNAERQLTLLFFFFSENHQKVVAASRSLCVACLMWFGPEEKLKAKCILSWLKLI